MQVDTRRYQCDNCNRVFHQANLEVDPDGWRKFILRKSPDPVEEKDICDSCTSALVSALGQRKRTEKGRHLDVPLQEYSVSPRRADAIAMAQMKKAD